MKPYLTNCCDLPGQISLFDSAESGGATKGTELWPTDLSMRNTGECPNADAEYTLAAILVDDPPTRYFLSVRAMDGILSRASRRGKQLPELLVTAIAGMKEWWRQNLLGGGYDPAYTMKIRSGCEGGGKGPLVQNDLSATLATHQEQTVFAPARDKCLPINMMLATRCKALGRGTGIGVGDIGEPQYTTTAGHEHAVAYVNGTETVARTLTARADGSPMLDRGPNVVIQKGNEHERMEKEK